MTKTLNIKELTSMLFAIWILTFGIHLKFGACNLLFPIYPGLVPQQQNQLILPSSACGQIPL